jgi:hypothetical protein
MVIYRWKRREENLANDPRDSDDDYATTDSVTIENMQE